MFHNRLLDRLPPTAAADIAPLLTRVRLRPGEVLVQAGDPVATAHFPIDCQVANRIALRNGGTTEVSAIGAEGVTGLAPVLAGVPSGWEVAVRQVGDAWAIPGPALAASALRSPPLMERLLVLAAYYQTQASVSAACVAHHPVSARLARFLLTASDLTPAGTLSLTQDDLARALGATRSTVSPEAAHLKDLGAVTYSRGRIRIVERRPLERQACECYGILRATAERDGLLGPKPF